MGDGILQFVADVGGGISLFVVDGIAAEFAPLIFQPQPQRTLEPEALIIQYYLSRLILANAR